MQSSLLTESQTCSGSPKQSLELELYSLVMFSLNRSVHILVFQVTLPVSVSCFHVLVLQVALISNFSAVLVEQIFEEEE